MPNEHPVEWARIAEELMIQQRHDSYRNRLQRLGRTIIAERPQPRMTPVPLTRTVSPYLYAGNYPPTYSTGNGAISIDWTVA